MKIIIAAKITWAILVCVFTDPMSDHTIKWDDEGNIRVIHGRKWTAAEILAYWFPPRIDR